MCLSQLDFLLNFLNHLFFLVLDLLLGFFFSFFELFLHTLKFFFLLNLNVLNILNLFSLFFNLFLHFLLNRFKSQLFWLNLHLFLKDLFFDFSDYSCFLLNFFMHTLFLFLLSLHFILDYFLLFFKFSLPLLFFLLELLKNFTFFPFRFFG